MRCCGIRGAITVDSNTKASIVSAAKELLTTVVGSNNIALDDIAAIWFTMTGDLNAEFPAVAARELGWTNTALMCGNEADVEGSLKSCLRVLMLVNTEKNIDDIIHVYLKGAVILRPDRDITKDKKK